MRLVLEPLDPGLGRRRLPLERLERLERIGPLELALEALDLARVDRLEHEVGPREHVLGDEDRRAGADREVDRVRGASVDLEPVAVLLERGSVTPPAWSAMAFTSFAPAWMGRRRDPATSSRVTMQLPSLTAWRECSRTSLD
jgi:hypothetical protein